MYKDALAGPRFQTLVGTAPLRILPGYAVRITREALGFDARSDQARPELYTCTNVEVVALARRGKGADLLC
jgi:hypothetical protein